MGWSLLPWHPHPPSLERHVAAFRLDVASLQRGGAWGRILWVCNQGDTSTHTHTHTHTMPFRKLPPEKELWTLQTSERESAYHLLSLASSSFLILLFSWGSRLFWHWGVQNYMFRTMKCAKGALWPPARGPCADSSDLDDSLEASRGKPIVTGFLPSSAQHPNLKLFA